MHVIIRIDMSRIVPDGDREQGQTIRVNPPIHPITNRGPPEMLASSADY